MDAAADGREGLWFAESNPYEVVVLDSTERACAQTEHMVQALLELARLDAGTVTPVREPVELDELVREVMAPLTARIAERQLRVTTELAPLSATTGREQLRVILKNLLDNAVAYADDGGAITVRVDEQAIVIANTGCTLASAEHVFDRFWRGDAARTAGTHAGLGLALCKKLVELLGGTIDATIEDGRFIARIVGLCSNASASPVTR